MKAVILINEDAGIHLPRKFYENFDLRTWGLEPTDYQELQDPEHELYWDLWEDLLSKAIHYNTKGVWKLDHNNDLYTYLHSPKTNIRSIKFETNHK